MTPIDVTATAARALPLTPKNPLPYLTRFKAARAFTDGQVALHQADGPVTRSILGPKWLTPPLVFVARPRKALTTWRVAPMRPPNAATERTWPKCAG